MYCPKQVEFRETAPDGSSLLLPVFFLDCDSICVGQQARCITAFLLLLAAEWAASNRYECISWEEIIFFHCPVFCDEPLLLIQCATGDLFCLFILFIVFFKKLFLDEEG